MRSGIQLLQPLLENLGLPPRSEDAEVFRLVDRAEPLVDVPGKALHVHGDAVDDGVVIQHGLGEFLVDVKHVRIYPQKAGELEGNCCYDLEELVPARLFLEYDNDVDIGFDPGKAGGP